MKTGLVLEGGAMRGMYTVGVLDVFLENQIAIDGIVGVSAGALFGVNYLSGQKGRAIRYSKRFNKDKNYLGLLPLIREGNIVSTRYAYDKVPHKLDPFDEEAFMNSGTPFYAVATNIETGKPEYIHVKSVFQQMDALRASGSMPFLSQPVTIGEQQYLDGGISDSIPFEWLSSQGYDKLIIILTRDIDYRKTPMSSALTGLYKRKYPEFAKKLENRHTRYNESAQLLKQWEAQGKAFVIRPSRPIRIGRIEKDPDQLQCIYDLGALDGKKQLKALQDYLTT